ncbi:hypothetical protein SUGI_0697750 [Cryptomeria japonica]|nr:hypothetical protein SUGI_0697750 [Cryptomeria japonica]
MKAYAFIILLFLFSLSLGDAARSLPSMKTHFDLNGVRSENSLQKGSMEHRKEVHGAAAARRHEAFPSVKLEEINENEGESGSGSHPMGHSPGIGHGNSPDGRT